MNTNKDIIKKGFNIEKIIKRLEKTPLNNLIAEAKVLLTEANEYLEYIHKSTGTSAYEYIPLLGEYRSKDVEFLKKKLQQQKEQGYDEAKIYKALNYLETINSAKKIEFYAELYHPYDNELKTIESELKLVLKIK